MARDGKESVSVRIDSETMERLRNAIFWIGQGLTISGLLEEAMTATCERLEREHNKGKPFKPRTKELPKSRRKRDN